MAVDLVWKIFIWLSLLYQLLYYKQRNMPGFFQPPNVSFPNSELRKGLLRGLWTQLSHLSQLHLSHDCCIFPEKKILMWSMNEKNDQKIIVRCSFNKYIHMRSLVKNLLAMQESFCNVGDMGSIPGSGRSHGEGNGDPLPYPCLWNPMDRIAWQATIHEVARVRHNLATKPPTSDNTVTLSLLLRIPYEISWYLGYHMDVW